MHARLIAPESAEWRHFLARTPHDFYHLPEYVRLDARHQGGRPHAFLAEEGEYGLLVPFILRPVGPHLGRGETCYDAIGPYGFGGPLLCSLPGGDPASFVRSAIDQLMRELQARQVVAAFCRLHPTLPMPLEPLLQFGHVVHHGETVLLDLTVTTDEMWRQTRENHRRGITRAQRAGYSVEVDTRFRELETFFEIYCETMRRVDAGAAYFFPREYFLALRETLGSHVHLCVVRDGDEVLCGGLFTDVCGLVQYHLGGTRDAYLKHQPSKLMFHFIRDWAKQRGSRLVCLGAGVGGCCDALYHFKAGFSELCAPFRTWRLIVDDRAYQALAREWQARYQATPDGPDGYFPAYRRPAPAGSGGLESDPAPTLASAVR